MLSNCLWLICLKNVASYTIFLSNILVIHFNLYTLYTYVYYDLNYFDYNLYLLDIICSRTRFSNFTLDSISIRFFFLYFTDVSMIYAVLLHL